MSKKKKQQRNALKPVNLKKVPILDVAADVRNKVFFGVEDQVPDLTPRTLRDDLVRAEESSDGQNSEK